MAKRTAPGKSTTASPRRRAAPARVAPERTALGEAPPKRGLKAAPPTTPRKPETPPRGELRVNVKTARHRPLASTLWLDRQLNDPYVARARAEGWRSRAAFKLLELDDRFRLISRGGRVVDLGCAPGGWLQALAARGAGPTVGVDLLPTAPVPGAVILEADFLAPSVAADAAARLGGPADLVLSDMAAPTTGHRATDHLRIVALADAALDFAETVLAPGGAFVCKVFQGGAAGDLLDRLKRLFVSVRHAKPRASRAESAEIYVVATGFRGAEGEARS